MTARSRRSLPPVIARARGFSLLEVTVTLAILALMLALLPGVLDLGRQALRAQRSVEREEQLSAADALLRRLGATIRAARRPGADGRVILDFAGEGDSVAFVAAAPAALADAGLVRWRLAPVPARSGRAGLVDVVMSIGPSPPAGDPATAEDAARRSVLVEDATGLSIAYFGAPDDAPAPRWQARWSGRDRLPELIDVAITVDGTVRTTTVPLALAR